MLQQNNALSVKILGVVLAVVVVALIGCRIGGYFPGDANPLTEAGAENLSLAGTILVPSDALASIQANRPSTSGTPRPAELSGHLPMAGADVWLEELPDFPHEKTDKEGKYEFKRIPPGIYRVVASFKKADNTIMKTRSDAVEITSKKEKTTVSDLALVPAGKVVSGVLRGADGECLPAGTVLILWGEKFTVGQNGTFTTPPLPNNVDAADILVAQTGVAKASQPKVTVQFFSADSPTTVEVQVGGKDTTYQPIGASINVKKGGQPVTTDNKIGKGDLVDLSLTLTNIDRTFTGITFEWDAGRGTFSTAPGNSDTAVWVAPASSGMATISVKISAPARGFCKVFLPLVVDIPVKAPTFEVSFDAQGGTSVVSQSIDSGAKVAEPTAPTRTNYTFAGWYKDTAFANQWNFATDTVTAAVTLYAKWTGGLPGPFTLTYSAGANGTLTGSSTQTVASGSNGTAVTAVATVGFTFVNWSDARTDNPRTDTNVTANVNVTANFVANVPIMTLYPASGANIFVGRNATLKASGTEALGGLPVATATLVWYLDGAPWGKSGSPITVLPGDWGGAGTHQVSVIGTDQFGSPGSVTSVINYGFALPSITSPASGTTFPTGTSVNYLGAPNSNGPTIMQWWQDWASSGVALMGAGDNIFFTLPNGRHMVTYVATDSVGNVASTAIQILMNDPPTLTAWPASGSGMLDTLAFNMSAAGTEAVSLLPLNTTGLAWYHDEILWGARTGTTITVNPGDLTTGWHAIRAQGPDSFGTVGSVTTNIFVNQLPQISTITVVTPYQYGTGPMNIAIVLASAGTDITFAATATDYEHGGAPMPGASMSWFVSGLVATQGTGLSFQHRFDPPGSYTVTCRAIDNFGGTTERTQVVWVWDSVDYTSFPGGTPTFLASPTAIGANGANDVYVADQMNHRLLKLHRDSTTGDLDAVASQTNGASLTTSLWDIALYPTTGSIYTLEDNAGGQTRIRRFSLTTLEQTQEILKGRLLSANPDNYWNARGITIQTGLAIYVSDTGNGWVKRLDIINGNYFASQTNPLGPRGLLYQVGDQVLVAESLGAQVSKYTYPMGTNTSLRCTGATDATLVMTSLSGKIYVSGPAVSTIYVYDASGNFVYKFGVNGLGLGQFQTPYGMVVVDNDLYVTDSIGNCIHRFRFGAAGAGLW